MSEGRLEWVIVGGGIHGVHLAVRLIASGRVASGQLVIVDPGPRLLDTWRRCTGNTGMRFLRSPVVHHLDIDPWSLQRFASTLDRPASELFAAPYARPATELFEAHCDQVIARYGLAERHLRGRVVGVDLTCDAATVRLDDGRELSAHQVILAIGASEQPQWPAWAVELRRQGAPVHHVFEPGFELCDDDWHGAVAVIGGGITGAQVALRLAEAVSGPVHLVTRHPLREHTFDSDPGWIGPKNMRGFLAIDDPDARRRTITAARHRGSVTKEVHRPLRRRVRDGSIVLHRGEPHGIRSDGRLQLTVGDAQVAVDGVLLATGFAAQRPGGPMVDAIARSHGLSCATCGYPVVDHELRWHPRLYVSGPLAELSLGPVARNIIGARRAAERIVGRA